MDSPRYLCSQLVRLLAGDREQWAVLGEIWETGAVLDCEEAVADGLPVGILADDVTFSGRVAAVKQYEFGWQVEVRFSPLTPWRIERWQPEHALNPAKL